MTDLDRPWVVDSTPNKRFPLYTRANVAETAPTVVSPLFWTMVAGWRGEQRWRTALVDFGVFDADEFRPDEADIMPVFHGYIYLNMSVHRVLGVRTPGADAEAMDIAFFGENPDVPPYDPQPGDDDARYETRAMQSIQRVLATTARPDLDEDRDEAADIRKNRPDFSPMSDEQLVGYARDIIADPFRRNHEKVYPLVHESSIPVAMLHQLLSSVPNAPAVVELVSGLGEIDSAEPTRAMWRLSRTVRESPELSHHLHAGVDGLLDRLRGSGSEACKVFLGGFEEFLLEFGSRGTSEWDICTVTWETHQEAGCPAPPRVRTGSVPLGMIERLRLQDESKSPMTNAERLCNARERLTAEVRRALIDSPDSLAGFDQALSSAHAHMVARERNKTNAVRVLQEARLAVRELGQRMVERGHFQQWDNISMLREDELDTLLDRPDSLGQVAKERLEWAAQLQELVPPFVVEGEPPPPSTWQKRVAEAARLPVRARCYRGSRPVQALQQDAHA